MSGLRCHGIAMFSMVIDTIIRWLDLLLIFWTGYLACYVFEIPLLYIAGILLHA